MRFFFIKMSYITYILVNLKQGSRLKWFISNTLISRTAIYQNIVNFMGKINLEKNPWQKNCQKIIIWGILQGFKKPNPLTYYSILDRPFFLSHPVENKNTVENFWINKILKTFILRTLQWLWYEFQLRQWISVPFKYMTHMPKFFDQDGFTSTLHSKMDIPYHI